ncbi:glycosyltransferase family 4 protein [Aminirod propionatiphilus]|uniref:Glycosyltransferase family 4 protein n=1 Tax=Aminirod propionatiphilus TaxID=3415223 RepID=A0ACD1DUX1_9BACT|nr:glycosyltransferase family 4 protein [Synergistota bacterium]
MKILYLHQYFNTPAMAGGTRSYEMGRRLVAWGHEVHMITTDRDGRFPKDKIWHETEEAGIHVHWTPVPYGNAMPYNERIKAFFAFSWRAARRAVAIGGDIVFATSTPLTIAIPGVYASKRLGIPMVFEVRDLWPEVPIALGALKNPLTIAAAEWLEGFAYRNAARVVTLSPGMMEGVIKKGVVPDRVTMIPNGCDIDLFQNVTSKWRPEGVDDSDFMAIFAGAHGLANGLDALLDAAVELQKKGANKIKVVLIGNGAIKKSLQKRAKKENLKNVIFCDYVSKNRLVGLFASADLGLQILSNIPEFHYGSSPNKFFDYIASGLPVLINYPGWLDEEVKKNKIGISCSENSIADGIWDYYKGERISRQHVLTYAINNFSRDFLAKKIMNFIDF